MDSVCLIASSLSIIKFRFDIKSDDFTDGNRSAQSTIRSLSGDRLEQQTSAQAAPLQLRCHQTSTSLEQRRNETQDMKTARTTFTVHYLSGWISQNHNGKGDLRVVAQGDSGKRKPKLA